MIVLDKTEKKLIAGLNMLLGIRMLGVSMIIPVFSIYAIGINGANKELVGYAIGIFSVFQTIFQVPFGRLSDRCGRKNATILGLLIYLIGTILSGLSSNIYMLIISRIIAGSGAVSGVIMAWLADGIDSEKRNYALSFVGTSMGLSVLFGYALSPIIFNSLG
jgi:MFS family permease